jgi:predicted nucleotidyltransferase
MTPYSKGHFDVLKAFWQHGVKFIVIGGHAAIYHGVRRNTGDIDILTEPTRKNGEKVIKALKELNLELPAIEPEEFEKELVLSFGLEPDAVDILNYTPGITFDSAYENSTIADFNGVSTRIINLEDLIKNKENLHREGQKSLLDKYDLEVLKKIRDRKKDGEQH